MSGGHFIPKHLYSRQEFSWRSSKAQHATLTFCAFVLTSLVAFRDERNHGDKCVATTTNHDLHFRTWNPIMPVLGNAAG
jgi:hypothetical protein